MTGFEVRVKAEMLQRTGSYKIRGPLYKLTRLSEEERARGVVSSSAGNHAQGVALAAKLMGVHAVVVMAENATPAKVAATKGYGAKVVQYGTLWDEANQKALELVREHGLTMVHPFDDLDLIAGQSTVGQELVEDWPDVDVVVVPIGGGGLISGVSTAVKQRNPRARVIGVESAGAPAMKASIKAGHVVTLDELDCTIDGLKVKRVGEHTFDIVRRNVDEIVTLPDNQIYDAVPFVMSRLKLVAEGAACAPVAALVQGLIQAQPGSKVALVLSGGNLDVEALRGRTWN